MADDIPPDQRRETMPRIRSTGTTPEASLCASFREALNRIEMYPHPLGCRNVGFTESVHDSKSGRIRAGTHAWPAIPRAESVE
jgi:hypothetical protein